MTRLFSNLYTFFGRRRIFLFILVFLLCVLSGFFVLRLDFEEDITRIMPGDEQLDKISRVYREFEFIDKLVVTVSSRDTLSAPTPGKLLAFTESLVDSIEKELVPRYIREVFHSPGAEKGSMLYDHIYQHLPIYLHAPDYALMDSLIQDPAVRQTLAANYRDLISPAGTLLKKYILLDPLHFTTIPMRRLTDSRVSEGFVIYRDHIFTSDLTHLLFFITPSHPTDESGENSRMLKELDRIIDEVSLLHMDVKAEYYGGVAVAAGNANRIKKDISLTISIALLLIFLLLTLFFRRGQVFFIIFFPAVFGAILSLAVLFFTAGKVSAISLAIGSVLVGITIDYGLHFFTHYRLVRQVDKTINDLAQPILLSSLTTASAFLCLLLLRSDVLGDLGLFAATSILAAALFCLVILPHINGRRIGIQEGILSGLVSRITSYRYDGNRYVVFSVLLLSLFFLFFAGKVGFDGNMYNMNYMSRELVTAERNLNRITDLTLNSTYLISTGIDLEEALRNNEEILVMLESLKEEGMVTSWSSPGSILISGSLQQERIRKWNEFWTEERKQRLFSHLEKAGAELKFNEKAFTGIRDLLNREYTPVPADELRKIYPAMVEDWISGPPGDIMVATQVKSERTYRQLIDEYFSNSGVIVFDKSFIAGKLIEVLRSSFRLLVVISLLVVFLILVLSFGRIELALIAFLPLMMSWLWTLGIMGFLDVKFTIFNIIISTFVFGLGIDYSIFIMRGLLQEYKYGAQNLSSYKTSIFLSAATTLIGIGALIFAKHPALQSIAAVSIAGIASVIVISYTVLPLLFRWLMQQGNQSNPEPLTLPDGITATAGILILLLTGSLFLIPIGTAFLLCPKGHKRQKITCFLLSSFSRAVLICLFFIRKEFKFSGTKDRGPAVYPVNIRGGIDLIITTCITRRFIILDPGSILSRFRNNPLTGILVRLLDSSGMDNDPETLRKLAEAGYSIVYLLPDNTMESSSCPEINGEILSLASLLNLGIIPVKILITGGSVGNYRILFRRGRIKLERLAGITPPGISQEKEIAGYLENVNRKIREACDMRQSNFEVHRYSIRRLMNNFIYKGPVLEWYLRIKLRLEDRYKIFHDLLPPSGSVTDLGCGYGFMAYMLKFLGPARDITGIDHDIQKIRMAGNCRGIPEGLRFVEGNVLKSDLPQSDAFILSDVLHYLPEEMQHTLIRKCIKSLSPEGRIIIRDGDCELKSRHRITRLSEFFSTRLGFNRTLTGSKKLFFPSGAGLIRLFASHGFAVRIIDNTRFTSNRIFLATRV